MKNELAAGGRGINVFLEAAEANPSDTKITNCFDQVRQGTPKTVKLLYDQNVSWSAFLQRCVQPRPCGFGTAYGVSKQTFTAQCQECIFYTVRSLGDIADEAFALVSSLDATQQQAAILGGSVIDLVLGPGQDGKTIQAEGLSAAQMTADQQAALLKLIGHYTGLVNDEEAAS